MLCVPWASIVMHGFVWRSVVAAVPQNYPCFWGQNANLQANSIALLLGHRAAALLGASRRAPSGLQTLCSDFADSK